VLAAADGAVNAAIARQQLAVCLNTVRKWRGRFAQRGLEGLKDAARSGRGGSPRPPERLAGTVHADLMP
jgi:hypothetical protein